MDWKIIIDFFLKLAEPLLKVLGWLYSKSPFELKWKKQKPKLGIIEDSFKGHTWSIWKKGSEEFLNISTNWHITNTLPYNLTALNVFLTRPKKVKGRWIAKDTKSNYWGSYSIPTDYTTDVTFSFKLDRKYAKKETSVLTVDIVIIDPIGHKHKIKRVKVLPSAVREQRSDESDIPIENTNRIRNTIERNVVAVLKDELEQYKVRGRREGRLGTVEWPKGVIEWRTQGEKIEFLHNTSNKDHVRSRNTEALVKLYGNSDEQGKKIIIKALKKRLNKQTEYSDVGYIIVLTLFELRLLPMGLNAALKYLKGGSKHGFGDTLRLLDFLLAFRYKEFDKENLNIAEKVAFSTNEHTFRIKERINAIRIERI